MVLFEPRGTDNNQERRLDENRPKREIFLIGNLLLRLKTSLARGFGSCVRQQQQQQRVLSPVTLRDASDADRPNAFRRTIDFSLHVSEQSYPYAFCYSKLDRSMLSEKIETVH